MRIIYTLLLFCSAFGIAQNAPTFDTSFNETGRVTQSIYSNNYLQSVAVQSDQKILVGGAILNNSPSQRSYVLIRYNEDGSLDTSFASNGILYSTESINQTITKIIVQTDGKIIIGGTLDCAGYVGRLNSDGTFDTTFGNNGIQALENTCGTIRDLHLFDDGSILAYGSRGNTNSLQTRIMKLQANGLTDSSFGTNGEILSNFGYVTMINNAFAVNTDGSFVIAGSAVNNPNNPNYNIMFMAKYSAAGTIDTNFGANGIVANTLNTLEAKDIAIDTEGRIIIAGHVGIEIGGNGTSGNSIVARYNTDGTVDNTFNSNGFNTVNLHAYADYTSGILVDSEDRVYFAGHYYPGTGTAFYRSVVRFNEDGTFDSTFGSNGIFKSQTRTYTGESDLGNNVMSFTSDGKLVIGSYFNITGANNIIVIRLLLEPALSSTEFASNKTVIYPNPTSDLLHIESSEMISKTRIYSLEGKLLSAENQSNTLSVSNLPNGLYILETETESGKIQQFKFVKQ